MGGQQTDMKEMCFQNDAILCYRNNNILNMILEYRVVIFISKTINQFCRWTGVCIDSAYITQMQVTSDPRRGDPPSTQLH